MAKVDFLSTVSDGSAKKKPVLIGKLAVIPVLFGIASVILVLLSLYLSLMNFTYVQRMAYLEKKMLRADISVGKAKALGLQKDDLTAQMDILDGYLKKGVSWAVKLKQVQNLIPQEVWLTSLSFEARNLTEKSMPGKNTESLLLKGNLTPSEGVNFLGALSNFINAIKEDKDFYQDFDNLILAKSSSQTYKSVNTMVFEIRLPLKTQ